jgi:Flp pilus assembly protein TadG
MTATGDHSTTITTARPARRRFRFSLDPRGQSLVEFAISFPVVMLMILFGIDFGRVFVGWVTLNNAIREAANFAAINPNAWTTPGSATAQAEFVRLINAESANINCTLPNPLPTPTFPSGSTIGSPAVVKITCQFSLITPIVKNILGGQINVSASASFPIRSGLIGDGTTRGGLASFVPIVPTPSPFASVTPTGTPIPTPSAAPTVPPTCLVPNLVLMNTSQATRKWTDNGFSANNLTFNPLVPPNYKINSQTLTAGDPYPCTSTMTVKPTP